MARHRVPLSVLDLAPVTEGSTAGQALRNSVDLARHVERWGYQRHWVAEHHNMPGIASSAPAVLIAHLADATTTLRVGSGGVMLPNHAPLVVAEQFGTLAALHPDRIDLGIGRAPGTDPGTARALRRSVHALSADDFPEQLAELLDHLGVSPDGDGATRSSAAVPRPDTPVPIWLLGSSGYSAQLAGYLGLPFAFAHHFSPVNTLPALDLYRTAFRPSAVLDRPYAMVCASVIVAESDDGARRLAAPIALAMLHLRQGRPRTLPSPETALAYPYTDAERAAVEDHTSAYVVGGPDTVRAGVDRLLEATQADELMATTIVFDHADRLRSYELLAQLMA
jgi:luciferase family oxidoreductase group 1